jgi:hypothetical protein
MRTMRRLFYVLLGELATTRFFYLNRVRHPSNHQSEPVRTRQASLQARMLCSSAPISGFFYSCRSSVLLQLQPNRMHS